MNHHPTGSGSAPRVWPERWKLGIALLAVSAVSAVMIIAAASNPLRKPDEELRAWLLAKTPLGSSMADVRAILDQHGWHDAGYQPTPLRPAAEVFLGGEIGRYQELPWQVSVRAYWEFDSSERLADIRIDRIEDSL